MIEFNTVPTFPMGKNQSTYYMEYPIMPTTLKLPTPSLVVFPKKSYIIPKQSNANKETETSYFLVAM